MSRRMGQDKGLMLLDKNPMILHVLEKLEGHVNEVILVLRDDTQLKHYESILKDKLDFNFSLKLVKDIIINQGPLAGIYTGLNYIKSDYALVVPCDSPYISSTFIENIFQFLEKSKKSYDAFISIKFDDEQSEDSIQPLHSIYHKNSKEKISILLSQEKRDVKSLIKDLDVYFIDLDQLDSSHESFMNLNRPEDLK